MPRSVLYANVRQAPTRVQEGITHAVLHATAGVFDHPRPFHPTHRVRQAEADRRDAPLDGVLRRGQLTPTGCLLGVNAAHIGQDPSLAAPLVITAPPRGPCIASPIGQTLIRPVAVRGGPQDAHVTGGSDHEEGFARVAFRRAAGRRWRLLGLWRAVPGVLCPSRPTRGAGGPACVGVVVRRGAHASGPTGWRRCRHLGACEWDLPKSGPGTSWMGGWVPSVTMQRRVSALVGTGHWASGLSRRRVRGCPSMVRARREAPHASATRGSRAVNACAVNPVLARQLPARWGTASSRGLDPSHTR